MSAAADELRRLYAVEANTPREAGRIAGLKLSDEIGQVLIRFHQSRFKPLIEALHADGVDPSPAVKAFTDGIRAAADAIDEGWRHHPQRAAQ